MAGTFAGFEPYRLTGVEVTDEEYGRGSYAAVVGVKYRGLKCAGKKLHIVLVEQGVREIVYRFEGECRLLAQMRHPNIVQFIGVYFEEDSENPILVMEFLPTTLTRCIDTYGVLPEEISYSILHDVALGLCHLHSQTPPIVHRDLSANNVLLTPNMNAKISDLGVAKILNLTPLQLTRMTQAPGTLAYMPPEALSPNPRYDTRIDEFSFGVLMIHILCGRWPMPCEAVRVNPANRAQLLPVSEAERREEYLQDIGNAHPLMDLILRCVSNDPEQRPRAADIVQQMEHTTLQFPPTFANRVTMLRQIGADETEKEQLRNEKNATQALLYIGGQQRRRLAMYLEQSRQEAEIAARRHVMQVEQLCTESAATQAQLREEIQRLEQLSQHVSTELEQSRQEAEIAARQHVMQVEQLRTESAAAQMQLREEIQRLERLARHRQEELERSELAHSIEIEQLRLRLAELQTESEANQTELRTKIETHQAEMRAQSAAREEERRTLGNRQEVLAEEIARMRREIEELHATITSKDEVILAKDREIRSKDGEIRSKDEEIRSKDEEIQSKTAELSVKTASLSQIEIENERLQADILSKDREIESKKQEIHTKTQELSRKTASLSQLEAENERLQAAILSKDEVILSKDREIRSKTAEISAKTASLSQIEAENERLQAALLSKDREIESKQREIHTKTQELSAKDDTIVAKNVEISGIQEALATKNAILTERESELASKSTILEHQSTTVQRLHQQLTRAREFLAGQKPQPHPLHPQAKITWEPCSDLPVWMWQAQTVVIRDKVYCGGGDAANTDDDYRLFCYSPSEDTWTTLPPCPVRWFGLGQVRGKLVTVGGLKKSDKTNEVYEFDEVTQTWKPSIPPMPTARHSPAVLSHHSALIVAGGNTGHTHNSRTTAVEVFREETSQWHTTEPLPFRWCAASSLLINNRWYLLGGGAEEERYSNRALCAHVDLLLQRALDGNRASTDSNGTVWEVLPNTPLYAPAAATFGTSLLAVGGTTTSRCFNPQVTVDVYFPCTNTWIHISALPAPLVLAATAMLSPTELLVIGGLNKGYVRLNKVYKGLLQTE